MSWGLARRIGTGIWTRRRGLRYVCPRRGVYALIEFVETPEELGRLETVKAEVTAAYEAGRLEIAKWELPQEIDRRYTAERAAEQAGRRVGGGWRAGDWGAWIAIRPWPRQLGCMSSSRGTR